MKILIPLPSTDFDPSEVAIPWKILKHHTIVFASPDGKVASEDFRMMTGEGLGILAKMLMARADAVEAMTNLKNTKEFNSPIRYQDIVVKDFDGVLLPGGHAQGMRVYLESPILQAKVAEFFDQKKSIAAICHGMVLLARCKSTVTGKSVLFGKKVTTLPKMSELMAWNLTKKNLGNYYRTYPETTVEDEVKEQLASPKDHSAGPPTLIRDSLSMSWPGFVVQDEHLLTARWPGDAHKFAKTFDQMLKK